MFICSGFLNNIKTMSQVNLLSVFKKNFNSLSLSLPPSLLVLLLHSFSLYTHLTLVALTWTRHLYQLFDS
jgi:hypothetical protein